MHFCNDAPSRSILTPIRLIPRVQSPATANPQEGPPCSLDGRVAHSTRAQPAACGLVSSLRRFWWSSVRALMAIINVVKCIGAIKWWEELWQCDQAATNAANVRLSCNRRPRTMRRKSNGATYVLGLGWSMLIPVWFWTDFNATKMVYDQKINLSLNVKGL